jgi:uncharacterized membrane protein YfcA
MRMMGALLIGAGVGVLTGMFGVGGGFLITPLLNIVLGMPMNMAVGTGAMQILGVSTSGLYRRRGENLADYKLAVVLFGGNFAGVHLGAQVLGQLKGLGDLRFGERLVPAVDYYLLWVFLVLLGGIAGWLLYDCSRGYTPSVRIGLFARIKLPPYTNFDSLERPQLSIAVVSYFGLALGFLAGLLGIGGGVIILPALVYLIGMRTQRAAATSLALVWMSGAVATATHALAGNADILVVVPLLVGGAIGVQFGAGLGAKLGGPQLRRYFSFVVLGAMALIAARIVSILL